MKLIVLKGESGTGKSTTLRIVLGKLLSEGFKLEKIDIVGNPNCKDIRCILEDEDNSICLCTAGDLEKIIKDTIRVAEGYECNIIITALNNDLTRIIKTLSDYRPIYIDKKATETDELKINLIDAEQVYKNI